MGGHGHGQHEDVDGGGLQVDVHGQHEDYHHGEVVEGGGLLVGVHGQHVDEDGLVSLSMVSLGEGCVWLCGDSSIAHS